MSSLEGTQNRTLADRCVAILNYFLSLHISLSLYWHHILIIRLIPPPHPEQR
jgi:hypothetical protein